MPITQLIRYLALTRLPRQAVAAAYLMGGLLAAHSLRRPTWPQPRPETARPPWGRVAEKAAFSPRDTAEDVVFHGKMWLSNGYHAGGTLVRDLWSSSDGVTWKLTSDHTPYDGYSEMVVYDGKLWILGGFSNRKGVNLGEAWYTEDGHSGSSTGRSPCSRPAMKSLPTSLAAACGWSMATCGR